MNNTDEFEALWPCGVNAVSAIDPAPRPNDLNGKRIGFLWDNLFRGEEIFPLLEQTITEVFADVEIVGYDTFGSTFGGNEHEMLAGLPHQLRELNIDAVVSGIGC